MNEEKEYYVYKHTAPNGKVYIGQTCQKPENRWKNGKGYKDNQYFTRAVLKYGWDNFSHEILYSGLTKENADILEIELIKKYNSTNKNFGFNIDNGGNGKGSRSQETLKKMSDGRKGIPSKYKGVPLSEETRKKISEKNKGKLSPFRGKHHTDENKKVLSELRNDEKKSVICIETKAIYKSIREAERQTGINHTNISKVCHKKVNGNGSINLTAGGYHWCFLDEYDENTYVMPQPNVANKQKKVICIETGIIYDSLTNAAKDIGADINSISRCCNGENKTAGGYHWCFLDKYDEDTYIIPQSDFSYEMKSVICIETDEIYNSLTNASKRKSVSYSGISKCCRGVQKTAGGYHWMYYEDYLKEMNKEVVA